MAKIYVGTYAKYSAGSIGGAWLDCEDYSDHDEFIDACKELHSDESDPELMFQDFEDFPAVFYSESSISAELWDYLALDQWDQNKVQAYAEYCGNHYGFEVSEALDNVIYLADSGESDYIVAYNYCEESGVLSELPEHLRHYFDVEAYFRDGGPSVVRTSAGVFGILN